MEWVEIDGFYGEGGGQIFRMSVVFLVIMGKLVRIYNICVNRLNFGLRFQYFYGIFVLKEFSNVKIKGVSVGLIELEFIFGKVELKYVWVFIKIVGSIMFVF